MPLKVEDVMNEIWVAIFALVGSLVGSLTGVLTGRAQARATVDAATASAQAAIKTATKSAEAAIRTATTNAEAALAAARTTAEATINQAREAAGGPIFDAASARNAEFQNQRRDLYTKLLEALTDKEAASKVPPRLRAAQVIVKSDSGLGTLLDELAKDPARYQNDPEGLNKLADPMNHDAGMQ
ncbi:hypothetical protein ACFCYC_38245 [Streptomyces sp. NPDC056402]|uniref:hypothetical protein n=1 Tax=Streptomyces sp. NPDC056402 TaxID=3345810 RepID=UPI0035DE8D4E